MCPFGAVLMTDPVQAADGRTYQREVIELWFEHFNTSPIDEQPVPHKMLIPNSHIKMAVDLVLRQEAMKSVDYR